MMNTKNVLEMFLTVFRKSHKINLLINIDFIQDGHHYKIWPLWWPSWMKSLLIKKCFVRFSKNCQVKKKIFNKTKQIPQKLFFSKCSDIEKKT